MLLSPRKNGLTSLFKEVRVFRGVLGELGEFCDKLVSHTTKRPLGTH